MGTIKINRAKKIASVGKYHRTWEAIIETMEAEFIRTSTSKQIAQAADAMYASYQRGHSSGYRDAK